ncbi:MAG: hypothetical protein NXI01_03670 [Gammaproteobacteria bacterium]|nr:hypothetical protein [Gammaproteobacteria bacterium]
MYSRFLTFSHLLVILGGLFAFSDGVWSNAVHGFFYKLLDDGFMLLQEQTLLLFGSTMMLILLGIRARPEFLVICFLSVSVGVYEYIVSIFFDTAYYGFWSLINGFLFPAIWMLFLLRTKNQKLYFQSYYIGAIIFMVAALVVLFFFDVNAGFLKQDAAGSAITGLKGQYEGSWFFLIVGNVNKQSNYLLMSMLLGPMLLELEEPDRLYSVYVVLATVLLILLCSRATLMLLPIVLFLNKRYFLPLSMKTRVLAWLLLVILLAMTFDHLLTIFKFVFLNIRREGQVVDIMGTMNNRLSQWGALSEIIEDPSVLIHGIGIANYGLMLGGGPGTGTHNLFLDHLVASGLYGVIVLGFIVVYGLIKALFISDKRVLMGYIFFLALAFREYTFAYAFVTSMGGLIFIFLLYVTFNYPKKNECVANLALQADA